MLAFHVPDMTCGGCVNAITKALQALDAQLTLETNLERKELRVQTHASSDAIRSALVDAGFTPEPLRAGA